ncbi:MAG: hypothetical protein U5P41_01465 [Gammaproteobacteria bacterium]|nr:hypothetical protein [Gammaproteobacteria bacterium]
MSTLQDKARRIELAIFDVDGVLTDGRLILGDDGTEHKSFHVRDGLGLVLAARGRHPGGDHLAPGNPRSPPNAWRRWASSTSIRAAKTRRKLSPSCCERLQLDAQQAAYTGDDVLDLPVLVPRRPGRGGRRRPRPGP